VTPSGRSTLTAVAGTTARDDPPPRSASRDRARGSPPVGPGWRALARVELLTGAAAMVESALLIARPDGPLLHADQAVLPGGPFSDWRVPGPLLAGLVGGGWLLAGTWQWRGGRYARQLFMIAGLGLVLFEAAELDRVGLQPLQAALAGVGVLVFTLPAGSR
jgi:hypothetical protein